MRYTRLGSVIEVEFPYGSSHRDYKIEARYNFDKEKNKYALALWLKRKDIGDTIRITGCEYGHEIDVQYITSDKNDICHNICKLVEHADSIGFFDKYIEKYEFMTKCFDVGYEAITDAE